MHESTRGLTQHYVSSSSDWSPTCRVRGQDRVQERCSRCDAADGLLQPTTRVPQEEGTADLERTTSTDRHVGRMSQCPGHGVCL